VAKNELKKESKIDYSDTRLWTHNTTIVNCNEHFCVF